MNQAFMREAIRLSFLGMRQGRGGPFGAVVVNRGKIIGRGMNSVLSKNDPTAHAEIMAIRQACRKLGTFKLREAELYTSCEPCPMCLAAVYWARIPRLYYANTRADAAAIGFDDAFFYQELARPLGRRHLLMKGILRPEAIAAFREWHEKPDKVRY